MTYDKSDKIFKLVLLICGPSGCGKTFMEKQLCENVKNDCLEFNKCRQVTTRKPRSEEEFNQRVYEFISESEYDEMEQLLFSKTMVRGNRYGTLLQDIKDSDKFHSIVNTIIVNAKGIDDFKEYVENNKEEDIRYCVLYIDSEDPEGRDGRDNEFINEERKSLEGKYDIYLQNNASNRLTTDDIVNTLIQTKNLIR